MKIFTIPLIILAITGCATTDSLYYETVKSVSKDSTISSTACWSAITEIAKGGSEGAKVGAISLADKCKNDALKIEPPKKGWF